MKRILAAFFFLIILIGALYIIKFKPDILHGNVSTVMHKQESEGKITVDGQTFRVLIAKTQLEQEKGLGYRDALPNNEGMLFLFDQLDYQKFWMKGMRFPLDIIFIKDNRIITIYQNLPNPSPNANTWQIFSPTQPTNKVFEINAGLSKKYHFKEGDTVQISL